MTNRQAKNDLAKLKIWSGARDLTPLVAHRDERSGPGRPRRRY